MWASSPRTGSRSGPQSKLRTSVFTLQHPGQLPASASLLCESEGMEKGTSPSLQVEKIRYCITKLDRELRGLDDIKDLKVTTPSCAPYLCLCCVLSHPVYSDWNWGFPQVVLRWNLAACPFNKHLCLSSYQSGVWPLA